MLFYAITINFPFCLFLLLYICCRFKSLWHLFSTPFFERTVVEGRPASPAWDSQCWWHPAVLPEGQQDTAQVYFQSHSRFGSRKAEKPFCLEVWVVCGGTFLEFACQHRAGGRAAEGSAPRAGRWRMACVWQRHWGRENAWESFVLGRLSSMQSFVC